MNIPDVPLHWNNRIPLTGEDRARVALLRLAGCPCTLPLLGYNGGALTDGPRCRACGTRVTFTTAPDPRPQPVPLSGCTCGGTGSSGAHSHDCPWSMR